MRCRPAIDISLLWSANPSRFLAPSPPRSRRFRVLSTWHSAGVQCFAMPPGYRHIAPLERKTIPLPHLPVLSSSRFPVFPPPPFSMRCGYKPPLLGERADAVRLETAPTRGKCHDAVRLQTAPTGSGRKCGVEYGNSTYGLPLRCCDGTRSVPITLKKTETPPPLPS